MTDQFDNFTRQAKKYDNWISTNLEEKAHAREMSIENKAIEIYNEMLDSPGDLAEALQEAYSKEWMLFAEALGDAIRRETPSFDVQYLKDITDTCSNLLMNESARMAESWWDGL